MEWKTHINTTVNTELIREAKEKRINLSEATENGIREALRKKVILDDTEYNKEMAELEPEVYWINPEGQCRKRGQGQYFISEHGNVHETSKENYLFWLKHYGVKTKSIIPPKTEESQVNSAIRQSFSDSDGIENNGIRKEQEIS